MSNSQAIGVAYQDQDIVGSNMAFVNSTSGQFGYNTGSSTAVPTAVYGAFPKN